MNKETETEVRGSGVRKKQNEIESRGSGIGSQDTEIDVRYQRPRLLISILNQERKDDSRKIILNNDRQ